jgi:transcriptional regulator with XRE-family HTH domain
MTEKETRQEVGLRLQEIRGRRDQRTFAEAVDSVQQTISKYERGEIPRSWLFLARLAEAEGIDLNRLLTGRGAPGSTNGGGNGWAHDVSEEEREAVGAST